MAASRKIKQENGKKTKLKKREGSEKQKKKTGKILKNNKKETTVKSICP